MLSYLLNINNDYLRIFFLSMLPVTEQRFSIPYFILFEKLPWFKVLIISIIGNIFIGIVIFLLIGPFLAYLSKCKYLKYIIYTLFVRTQQKLKYINKYNKSIGLILFIAIPLPMTGVWTGALGAYLIKLPKRIVYLNIIFGVILCAIIVITLTLIGNEIWFSIIENEVNK